MYAVGAFEVGLSTLARQNLRLNAAQLGMMYTECALVMLIMQALFFAEPFKNFANRHLLFPAIRGYRNCTCAVSTGGYPQ